jgi:hypothetical protein
VGVVQFEVFTDGLFELPGRAMSAASDVVLRQSCKPALDLIVRISAHRGRSFQSIVDGISDERGRHFRLIVDDVSA